jgi:hypothetical protein
MRSVGANCYVKLVGAQRKPANLPVQGPTKYKLVINLKTANCEHAARTKRNPAGSWRG